MHLVLWCRCPKLAEFIDASIELQQQAETIKQSKAPNGSADSPPKEKKIVEIAFPDYDTEAFLAFLMFIYSSTIPKLRDPGSEKQLTELANRFDLEGYIRLANLIHIYI